MKSETGNSGTGNSGTGNSGTGNSGTGVNLGTVVAALSVVLLWASAFVGVEIALADISPTHLALARYLVASVAFGAVLLGSARVGSSWAVPARQDWLRLALAGGCGIALYNISLNVGQQTVSPGVASLLVNTVPVWTALLSTCFLGERITSSGWFGTTVAFVGVAIIALHRGGWARLDTGTLWVLTAAASQALYFVISKPLLTRYHPIEVTAYAVWCGSGCLLPFASGLIDSLQSCRPQTIGAIVFLGVGPAALAYAAWSYVLSAMPAGSAANLLFLVPVAAIGLGWLVLGEMPSAVALTGGTIAVIGVIISKRKDR